MTPSNSPTLLEFTGASTGTLLSELVVVKYPGLHNDYAGEPIAAGLNTWQLDPAIAPSGSSPATAARRPAAARGGSSATGSPAAGDTAYGAPADSAGNDAYGS